jgi:hypothetical protein
VWRVGLRVLLRRYGLNDNVGLLGLIFWKEYVKSFKPELIEAIVSWCKGAGFAEICKVGYLSPSDHLTIVDPSCIAANRHI